MSKKYYINNINTYIGNCLFEEIRNDIDENGEVNDDCNIIYGSYVDKDSSEKPEGVKKEEGKRPAPRKRPENKRDNKPRENKEQENKAQEETSVNASKDEVKEVKEGEAPEAAKESSS